MTTSPETSDLNHPVIRGIVGAASALSLHERITVVKGLIPGIAKQMNQRDFEGLVAELRLKGERYYDAMNHPGEGRKARSVTGERDLEER